MANFKDKIVWSLIILLVLAAIIIVWQVVQRTVKGGTGQIEPAAACMNINLEIVNASATDNKVVVTRKAGASDTVVSSIKFVIDGTAFAGTVTPTPSGEDIGVLSTKTYVLSGTGSDFIKGQKVEVAAVLSGGTVCNVADESIAKGEEP